MTTAPDEDSSVQQALTGGALQRVGWGRAIMLLSNVFDASLNELLIIGESDWRTTELVAGFLSKSTLSVAAYRHARLVKVQDWTRVA